MRDPNDLVTGTVFEVRRQNGTTFHVVAPSFEAAFLLPAVKACAPCVVSDDTIAYYLSASGQYFKTDRNGVPGPEKPRVGVRYHVPIDGLDCTVTIDFNREDAKKLMLSLVEELAKGSTWLMFEFRAKSDKLRR